MHLIQLINIITIHMPIIFSSDGYFLQEYFPSITIKIHALSILNIPHDACILAIIPLLTVVINIQSKKYTVLPAFMFNVIKYINIFRDLVEWQ